MARASRSCRLNNQNLKQNRQYYPTKAHLIQRMAYLPQAAMLYFRFLIALPFHVLGWRAKCITAITVMVFFSKT